VKLSKLVVFICLVLVLALATPFLSGCGEQQQQIYKIGISQILTHPALDATRQGIIDALADAGYLEEGQPCPAELQRKDVKFDYQNSEGDMTLVGSIAQKFVADKKDIIVSIATQNSQSAVNAAKGTDIPVVFSAVTDPVAAELISDWNNHPDENVTGVSDMINVKSIVELILDIAPDVKTIGTIYNAGEDNSIVLNDELKKACASMGIEVVERTVATSADVQSASQSLVGQVDAVWIGTDNTVVTGLEALVKVCEDNQIPLFPSDDASVERGGIATLGFDYYDIGYQTGEIVIKILEGEKASTIPVELGKEFYYSINVEAAQKAGLTIPESIVNNAKIVYGQ
jgi:putative ABC transport system substrate-binding protein